MLKLLTELCAAPGVSGQEGPVRALIEQELAGHCRLTVDSLGNLIAAKKGKRAPKHKILLTAHMDEVGFIITYIEESGLLRFSPVGGIDPRLVIGKTVEIGEGRLPGIIGIRAVHQQSSEERGKAPDFDALLMDIGAHSREEAEKHVKPGDRAVFLSPLIPFGAGLLRGKALDNRVACALLVELLKTDLPVDITCAFTVQEETGCVGARAVANRLEPEISIILETTTAADIADVAADRTVCKLGAGPTVSFMDRSTIYDEPLYTLALRVAGEKGLPIQIKSAVSGGNEAKSLQVGGGGSRVLALCIPTRYLHSPVCLLAQTDMESLFALLPHLLEEVGAL